MSKLSFGLLLLFAVFLCLSEAARPGGMLTRKFKDKQALEKFLGTRPKLWKSKPIDKARHHYYRRLMGGVKPTMRDLQRAKNASRHAAANMRQRQFLEELPASFDARQKWPQCSSIRIIQDQSNCGSCWAVGTASAMSDRVCIATNGQRQPRISAADLMSCCRECQATQGDGCKGGIAIRAWESWRDNGIVSGGKYGSREGCLPYPFPACNRDCAMTQGGEFPAPQCSQSCQNGRSYKSDKHYGSAALYIETVEAMQRQLYDYGPISVSVDVYSDFMTYTGGIYYHQSGESMGGHTVRLIGWGEENGVPYWLVANSWGESFGEKGLFKWVRGTNHCNIEKYAFAGYYDYERSANSS